MADIYRLVDGGFLAILSQTEDPRDRRGLVYSIESLLTIAICTYLCNGNTFVTDLYLFRGVPTLVVGLQ